MLADPSPVDSSVSAGGDCRSPSREVEILVKSVAVPVLGLGGRVTGLASHAFAPPTVHGRVDEVTLAVACLAPPLSVCSLAASSRGLLTATGTAECARALGATV